MPRIAIVGAGAAGLMAADNLSLHDCVIDVYEQMPTAGRKILWAGKTGLNITHSEPMQDFVTRYTPKDWLSPYLAKYDNAWLMDWLSELGVTTFVGSSGRVFPVEMKASKFLRAWLTRLTDRGVNFFYRHQCLGWQDGQLQLKNLVSQDTFVRPYDAIILACGGGSYARLGSTGEWQEWFEANDLTPLSASNVGICCEWSEFLLPYFGKPLKRVVLKVGNEEAMGDIVLTHYGLESGLIYRFNRLMSDPALNIYVDLLPQKTHQEITRFFSQSGKQSLSTSLKKLGLDSTKIALLREIAPKSDWQDKTKIASFIKALPINHQGFRPMSEAISTAGGVRRTALSDALRVNASPAVWCAGEMLDWDAPTGGYLLTACFATGRIASDDVAQTLRLNLR